MNWRSKIISKYVLADYAKWSKGKWVHFTDQPYLKLNPKQFHGDPAALYFFPEHFKTIGSWKYKKYKWVAEINAAAKVLDLSEHESEENILGLYDQLRVKPDKYFTDAANRKKASKEERTRTWGDILWEDLKNQFQGKPGAFAKLFINAGYDAIFDDTNAIFSGETQLLVLNQKVLQNLERIDEKGTGYERIDIILDKLADILKKYGKVTKKRPKMEYSVWDKRNRTMGSLYVTVVGDRGITWSVESLPKVDRKGARPIHEILISNPWKPEGTQGVYIREDWEKFDFNQHIPEIEEAMGKISKKIKESEESYQEYLKKEKEETKGSLQSQYSNNKPRGPRKGLYYLDASGPAGSAPEDFVPPEGFEIVDWKKVMERLGKVYFTFRLKKK